MSYPVSPPSEGPRRQVYQIDFTAVAAGKRIASSKRRVRWRFGFANAEALANGETGTACRGEEHDITLVWSITSGKRLVLADGQEVHYSSSRSGIFDYSWTMRGNHVLKIVAHASPPLSPTPGFRQYDFFVDGQSFFTFPKVYRLGMAPNDPRMPASPTSPTQLAERGPAYKSGPSANIAAIEAPSNTDEEEAYLREAIRQSLEDAPPTASTSATGGDLLDFAATTPAASNDPFTANAYNQWETQAGGGAMVPAVTTTTQSYASQYGINTAPTNGYAQTASYGGYPDTMYGAPAPYSAPAPYTAPAPYAAPQYNAPTSQGTQSWSNPPPIQTNWEQAPPPSSVTPMAQQTPSSLGFQSPPADFSGFTPAPEQSYAEPPYAEPPYAEPAPAPAMSMNSLYGQESLVGTNKKERGSLADDAYAKLMNMDTFSLVTKSDPPRSNPFDFGASSNSSVGGNASLADMKKQKAEAPKKEVMKSASMVVSSNPTTGYGQQYGMQPMQQQGFVQAPPTQYGQQPTMPMYGQQQQQQQQPHIQQQPPMYGQQQQPHIQQQPPMYGQQPPYAQPPQMAQYGQQPSYGGQQYGQPGF